MFCSALHGLGMCVQLLFHPLHEATVKAVNQNQMKGKTPDTNLIQDSEMKHLVEKFNLMEEMFGKKASDQTAANKQVNQTAQFSWLYFAAQIAQNSAGDKTVEKVLFKAHQVSMRKEHNCLHFQSFDA